MGAVSGMISMTSQAAGQVLLCSFSSEVHKGIMSIGLHVYLSVLGEQGHSSKDFPIGIAASFAVLFAICDIVLSFCIFSVAKNSKVADDEQHYCKICMYSNLILLRSKNLNEPQA